MLEVGSAITKAMWFGRSLGPALQDDGWHTLSQNTCLNPILPPTHTQYIDYDLLLPPTRLLPAARGLVAVFSEPYVEYIDIKSQARRGRVLLEKDASPKLTCLASAPDEELVAVTRPASHRIYVIYQGAQPKIVDLPIEKKSRKGHVVSLTFWRWQDQLWLLALHSDGMMFMMNPRGNIHDVKISSLRRFDEGFAAMCICSKDVIFLYSTTRTVHSFSIDYGSEGTPEFKPLSTLKLNFELKEVDSMFSLRRKQSWLGSKMRCFDDLEQKDSETLLFTLEPCTGLLAVWAFEDQEIRLIQQYDNNPNDLSRFDQWYCDADWWSHDTLIASNRDFTIQTIQLGDSCRYSLKKRFPALPILTSVGEVSNLLQDATFLYLLAEQKYFQADEESWDIDEANSSGKRCKLRISPFCLLNLTSESYFQSLLHSNRLDQAYKFAKLNPDEVDMCLVYQRLWHQHPPTQESIKRYLEPICETKNEEHLLWVLHEAATRSSKCMADQRNLLVFGLKQTERFSPSGDYDRFYTHGIAYRILLLRYLNMLESFEAASLEDEGYSFLEYRITGMKDLVLDLCSKRGFQKIEILLYHHYFEIAPNRLHFLQNIAESTDPLQYEALLPQSNQKVDHKLRSLDWSESPEIISKIVQALESFERREEFSQLTLVLENSKRQCSGWCESYTDEELEEWYLSRIYEIEAISGCVSSCFTLARTAAIDSSGLLEMYSLLRELEWMVYEHEAEIDLLEYSNLSYTEKLMKLCEYANTIADLERFKTFQDANEEFFADVMRRFADVNNIKTMYEIAMYINENEYLNFSELSLFQVVVECIYRCNEVQTIEIEEVLVFLESIDREGEDILLACLRDEVEAANIFARYNASFLKSVKFFHEEELIIKDLEELVRRATQEIVNWSTFLEDVLWLCRKFSSCSTVECEKLVLQGMLISNPPEFDLAREIIANSKEKIDVGLDSIDVDAVIIEVVDEHISSAVSIHSSAIDHAEHCLELLLEDSDTANKRKKLIEGLKVLNDIGIDVIPVEFQVAENRMMVLQTYFNSLTRPVDTIMLRDAAKLIGLKSTNELQTLRLYLARAYKRSGFVAECEQLCIELLEEGFNEACDFVRELLAEGDGKESLLCKIMWSCVEYQLLDYVEQWYMLRSSDQFEDPGPSGFELTTLKSQQGQLLYLSESELCELLDSIIASSGSYDIAFVDKCFQTSSIRVILKDRVLSPSEIMDLWNIPLEVLASQIECLELHSDLRDRSIDLAHWRRDQIVEIGVIDNQLEGQDKVEAAIDHFSQFFCDVDDIYVCIRLGRNYGLGVSEFVVRHMKWLFLHSKCSSEELRDRIELIESFINEAREETLTAMTEEILPDLDGYNHSRIEIFWSLIDKLCVRREDDALRKLAKNHVVIIKRLTKTFQEAVFDYQRLINGNHALDELSKLTSQSSRASIVVLSRLSDKVSEVQDPPMVERLDGSLISKLYMTSVCQRNTQELPGLLDEHLKILSYINGDQRVEWLWSLCAAADDFSSERSWFLNFDERRCVCRWIVQYLKDEHLDSSSIIEVEKELDKFIEILEYFETNLKQQICKFLQAMTMNGLWESLKKVAVFLATSEKCYIDHVKERFTQGFEQLSVVDSSKPWKFRNLVEDAIRDLSSVEMKDEMTLSFEPGPHGDFLPSFLVISPCGPYIDEGNEILSYAESMRAVIAVCSSNNDEDIVSILTEISDCSDYPFEVRIILYLYRVWKTRHSVAVVELEKAFIRALSQDIKQQDFVYDDHSDCLSQVDALIKDMSTPCDARFISTILLSLSRTSSIENDQLWKTCTTFAEKLSSCDSDSIEEQSELKDILVRFFRFQAYEGRDKMPEKNVEEFLKEIQSSADILTFACLALHMGNLHVQDTYDDIVAAIQSDPNVESLRKLMLDVCGGEVLRSMLECNVTETVSIYIEDPRCLDVVLEKCLLPFASTKSFRGSMEHCIASLVVDGYLAIAVSLIYRHLRIRPSMRRMQFGLDLLKRFLMTCISHFPNETIMDEAFDTLVNYLS